MSEHEQETDGPQEQRSDEADDLLDQQEGKGYGEDEGERDQSLPDE